MQQADVVVVGAGIIGASCAFRLAQKGLRVVILEAASMVAAGSTGRSAAGVRVQFSDATNILLSWHSILEYQQMPAASYRPQGYLLMFNAGQWVAHQPALELQRQLGVPVHELTLEQAQAVISFDAQGLAGYTHGPQDGVVDPNGITLYYLEQARQLGARLYLDSPLLAAERGADTWYIRTPSGIWETPLIINATGAWAGQVGQRAGLEIPVEPARRMIFCTAPLAWPHVYPLTVDMNSGFYLRSEGERILFGRSNLADQGWNEGMDWDWLEPTLAVGLERFPWLADTALDRRASWWGYYEVTPDHNPILGWMPGTQGWINACGFSGHGVQQAAAVGRLVAAEALGEAFEIPFDRLRYQRFDQPNPDNERLIV